MPGVLPALLGCGAVNVKHPAPFTPSIIEELRHLIAANVPAGHIVHDPFGGEGVRLGALCNDLGYCFTGTDLEEWPDSDPRVAIGDSCLRSSYPEAPHAVVTSPTYNNGVNDHFLPTENTRRRRRLTYRVALGRALHPNNTGRYSGRSSKKGEANYWRLTRDIVRHWPDIAIVNVKDSVRAGEMYPLTKMWVTLLTEHGYTIEQHDVACPGFRWGANRDLRADTEAILVAVRL